LAVAKPSLCQPQSPIIGVMEFEWDPAKAASNLAKHSVDFPTATKVFNDPNILLSLDPRSRGETRIRRSAA
jgi:uncharacterized DUF497 family protein